MVSVVTTLARDIIRIMNFAALKNTKRGFTLIEILVVIAIIGLLSSVVLASLATSRAKARDAKRIADLDEVKKALELYYDSNGGYPGTSAGWPYPIPSTLVTNGFIGQIPVTPPGAVDYKYFGTVVGPITVCSSSAAGDTGYVLGAQLERYDNVVLTLDPDILVLGPGCFQAIFSGNSVDCSQTFSPPQPGGGSSGERCYDIKL